MHSEPPSTESRWKVIIIIIIIIIIIRRLEISPIPPTVKDRD